MVVEWGPVSASQLDLQEWQRQQLVAAKTPSKELEELLPALARSWARSETFPAGFPFHFPWLSLGFPWVFFRFSYFLRFLPKQVARMIVMMADLWLMMGSYCGLESL